MSDYDRKVEAIQSYNQPLLDAFRAWLEESGLSNLFHHLCLMLFLGQHRGVTL